MKRISWLSTLLMLATGGLGVGLGVAWPRGTNRGTPTGDRQEMPEAGVGRGGDVLRRPPLVVEREVTARDVSGSETRSGGQDIPAAIAPARPSAEEIAFESEQAFQMDSAATSSSRSLEQSIVRAFRSPEMKGATLKKAECRATRCRLEVRFSDTATDQAIVRKLVLSPESPVSRMAMIAPSRETASDGTVLATLYFSEPVRAPETDD